MGANTIKIFKAKLARAAALARMEAAEAEVAHQARVAQLSFADDVAECKAAHREKDARKLKDRKRKADKVAKLKADPEKHEAQLLRFKVNNAKAKEARQKREVLKGEAKVAKALRRAAVARCQAAPDPRSKRGRGRPRKEPAAAPAPEEVGEPAPGDDADDGDLMGAIRLEEVAHRECKKATARAAGPQMRRFITEAEQFAQDAQRFDFE